MNINPELTVTFQPIATVTQAADGTLVVDFDWSDSQIHAEAEATLLGDADDDLHGTDPRVVARCDLIDAAIADGTVPMQITIPPN